MEINTIKSFPGARRKDRNRSMTFDVWCKWIASTIGETNICCESAEDKEEDKETTHQDIILQTKAVSQQYPSFPVFLVFMILLELSFWAFTYSRYNLRS